jgi:hypothetical protein
MAEFLAWCAGAGERGADLTGQIGRSARKIAAKGY